MRRRCLSRSRGFTYIGLLLAIAIMGAGMAAVAQVWHTTVQRANEAELQFVGGEFKRAIERYYESTPGAVKRLPATLEELVRDPRHPGTVRHLRKIYADPITGRTEWGFVKQDERILGVYSLSEKTPVRGRALTGEGTGRAKYSDWKFVAQLSQPVAAAAVVSPTTPVALPAEPAPPEPKEEPGPPPEPRPTLPRERCERLQVQDARACATSAKRAGKPDIQCEMSAQARLANCLTGVPVGPLWMTQ